MKILNLYAGLGGNRKLWGNDHEVTAVEYNSQVAQIYKDHFPQDNVIVGDAHEFLLKNYKDYDFVWASPPCPSHSRIRMMASKRGDYEPVYPDLKLYAEILFCQHYFKGLYCIENVVPYYEPLISPRKIVGRHCFWSNFNIGNFDSIPLKIKENNISSLEEMHGFDLSKYDLGERLIAQLIFKKNCATI